MAPLLSSQRAVCVVKGGSDYNNTVGFRRFLYRGKEKWPLCFMPLFITNVRWCKQRCIMTRDRSTSPNEETGFTLTKTCCMRRKRSRSAKSNTRGSWSCPTGWLCRLKPHQSRLWLILSWKYLCRGTEIQNSWPVTVCCFVIGMISWLLVVLI